MGFQTGIFLQIFTANMKAKIVSITKIYRFYFYITHPFCKAFGTIRRACHVHLIFWRFWQHNTYYVVGRKGWPSGWYGTTPQVWSGRNYYCGPVNITCRSRRLIRVSNSLTKEWKKHLGEVSMIPAIGCFLIKAGKSSRPEYCWKSWNSIGYHRCPAQEDMLPL